MRVKLAAAACVLFAIPCFCHAQEQQTQSAAQPSSPQSNTKAASPAVIPVGGSVTPAKLTHFEPPKYPFAAHEMGVQGTVVFSAVVGKNGKLEKVQFISGPQMLVVAATDCVKQWRYEPTKLNGKPIETETTVSVIFALVKGHS